MIEKAKAKRGDKGKNERLGDGNGLAIRIEETD